MDNNKQYITNIIKDEYKKWDNTKGIIIKSGTGSGKSHFIKYILYDYAKENNKKILLISNRDILKNQNNNELIDKHDVITTMNYQKIDSLILYDKLQVDLEHYDYIVCDEFHYFSQDAKFNNATDLSFKAILKAKKSIRIFMSATPSISEMFVEKAFKSNIIRYTLDTDYSYIDGLYFYNDFKIIEDRIINTLPSNEKLIYFSNDIDGLYNLHKTHPNSIFNCSSHNKKYEGCISDEVNTMVVEEKFNSQILFTTLAMDNGFNLKDSQIKHIIIDTFDPVLIMQCVGRKRVVSNDDKVVLYIKNRNGKSINGTLQDSKCKIKYAEELRNGTPLNLIKTNPRTNYGEIVYDHINHDGTITKKVNVMMYSKINDTIRICETLLETKDNNAYADWVSENFKLEYQIIDKEMSRMSLEEYLDGIVGVKLYKEEQIKFAEYIGIKRDGKLLKSFKTINGYFDESNVMYEIMANTDWDRRLENGNKNSNYGKVYWIIVEKIA